MNKEFSDRYIAAKRCLFIHGGSVHEIKLAFSKITKLFPDVDFIATDSDDIACRIIKTARSENIECPGQIGVSGFGNLPEVANYCTIPTVDQHPWHIGVEAVRSLLDMVHNGEPSEPLQIEVPAEVVNAEYI